VTGFGLANPKLVGEREAVVGLLQQVPANRPAPGTLLVGDKGFAGHHFQLALELTLVRPARADEPDPHFAIKLLARRRYTDDMPRLRMSRTLLRFGDGLCSSRHGEDDDEGCRCCSAGRALPRR
jgi:hypothetical protein